MPKIRVFDLVLIGAAFAALMFLLPNDKDAAKPDTKLSHTSQSAIQGVTPTNQKTITHPALHST
ncbi:MAG: hypothetical protein RL563_549 [Pseudomonadota bacterium]|jgi:hypothetical protein